jgi:dTDP-D-glucose 4,6-dehydratase
MVNTFTGNEAGITYTQRRDWDVKKRLLSSIEKAKKLLDYKPQTSFEDGLKHVHLWFKENWGNIQESAEFHDHLKQQWRNAVPQKTQEIFP